jgi:lysozyme
MARQMRISRPGLELIKSFEGFRARSSELPDGRWIIGYGHTASARKNLRVTRSDAELILRFKDLPVFETAVSEMVHTPLTANEFDALVSLGFNIGIDAFRASDTLKLLNEGNRLAAADAIGTWRKASIDGELRVVDALVRRRAAEVALFLKPMLGWEALPSAQALAELDIMSSGHMPQDRTIIVETGDEVRGEPRIQTKPRDGDDSAETAPQTAANAVTERLTRILGENASRAGEHNDNEDSAHQALAANDIGASDEPSVDEITQAISALAESDTTSQLSLLDEDNEDLPSLPIVHVDDFETLEVHEADRVRAALMDEKFKSRERREHVLRWLPFVLLCALGLVGLFIGLRDFLAVANPNGTISSVDELRFGPILMLGGGVLTAISAYYLVRAVRERE